VDRLVDLGFGVYGCRSFAGITSGDCVGLTSGSLRPGRLRLSGLLRGLRLCLPRLTSLLTSLYTPRRSSRRHCIIRALQRTSRCRSRYVRGDAPPPLTADHHARRRRRARPRPPGRRPLARAADGARRPVRRAGRYVAPRCRRECPAESPAESPLRVPPADRQSTGRSRLSARPASSSCAAPAQTVSRRQTRPR
jgi:hypothetical protein